MHRAGRKIVSSGVSVVRYLGSGIPMPFGLNVNFHNQGFSRPFAVFKHFLGAPKVKLYFHDSSRPGGKFKHFSRPVRTLMPKIM